MSMVSHIKNPLIGSRIDAVVVSRMLAILVTTLGLLVLIGWYQQNIALIQVYPTFVPMQYNTALGFVLSGIGLLLSQWQRPKMAAWFGLMAVLIGGLTLVEYIVQVDLGIDELFMQHNITTRTANPGRMAPNTALCFLLSGIVLIVVNLKPQWNRVTLLATLITGFGAIGFIGYLIGVETAFGWEHLTLMAVHTSAGFVVLGLGILLLGHRFVQNSITEIHLRTQVSIGVILLVVILSGWQALASKEEQGLQQVIQLQLERFDEATKQSLVSQVKSIERMAGRWKFSGGTPQRIWQNDAQLYLDHFESFQAIEWIDKSFNIRWTSPTAGNENTTNYNLSSNANRLIALQQAHNENSTVISTPVELTQGGYGVLICVPLKYEQSFDGFILGVISMPKLLKSILKDSPLNENYQVALFNDNSLMATNISADVKLSSQYQVSSDFTFLDLNWRIYLTPKHSYITNISSDTPNWVLFIGLFMSTLILKLVRLRQREQIKSQLLKQEIKARTLIEQDLEEKEQRLSATLENMVDAVILIDAKGHIQNFNKAAEQIFGYKIAQVKGKNINMLMPKPYHAEHDGYLKNYLMSGVEKIIGSGREVKGLRACGEVFPMNLAVSEIILNRQHFFSGIVRDITLQKKSENALKQYTARLERSNKELDNFAYVASHDLKAPLRGIMQLTDWIKEDLHDDENKQTNEYLNLMQNRIQRLENLLDDLLAYSRVGRKHGDFKVINIGDTVGDIFQLLNPPKSFTLVCEIDIAEFNTLVVPLELVLRNLISNAIKHHDLDNGTVTVSATSTPEGIDFIVIDDGPGIPVQHHLRVFQIFQTLKPRDEVEGSGMGLSIIKKVLEQYHCRIKIESEGIRGTAIHFNWPTDSMLRSCIDE